MADGSSLKVYLNATLTGMFREDSHQALANWKAADTGLSATFLWKNFRSSQRGSDL